MLPSSSAPAEEPTRVSLWSYACRVGASRQTLYYLVRQEFKARYRSTYLGFLWAILQPFALMLVLTAVFTVFAPVATDVPYPLLAFLNLSVWGFFAGGTTGCLTALVNNGTLMKKVYFPRMILPMAVVARSAFDFGVAFLGVCVLMAFYRVPPPLTSPLIVAPFVWQATFVASLGILFSMLNVHFRDLRHITAVLLQVWLFASPVIYPLSAVPEALRPAYMVNPMAGILTLYNRLLFQGSIGDLESLLPSLLSTIALAGVALTYFVRRDRNCVDLL